MYPIVTNLDTKAKNAFGQEDNGMKKFIPPIPESYSFVDENFLGDSFSVDGFVKRNSKRVNSLELLKEQLTAYLKTLKHSMVELINEDYTEFINLSSNLVSFDKSINNIKTPILKFKEETNQVQSQIEDIIVLLNLKQNRLKTIRNNKLKLNMTLEIIEYLNRLENNLEKINLKLNANLDEEKNVEIEQRLPTDICLLLNESSTLVCQMHSNFEYLLENQEDKHSNQFVFKLKEKFDKLSHQFYRLLENEIISLLTLDLTNFTSEQNSQTNLNEHVRLIEKIFRTYLLNGAQKELEQIISKNIVRPCFDLIIHDSYIAKNGTTDTFEKILQFIDTKCFLLIKVLTSSSNESFNSISMLGYELITATIWNQFVEYCTVRAGSIFSLANVDLFHHNYSAMLHFIEQFIAKTRLTPYRANFEQLESYRLLKSKFNLNVYFYMRLQQIAPKLEKSFTDYGYSLIDSQQQNTRIFKMNVTQILYDQIWKCWQTDSQPHEQNCIGDLFGYLWKITLKIIARYGLWLQTISIASLNQFVQSCSVARADPSQSKRLLHLTMGALIYDSQMFVNSFTSLYQSSIAHLWSSYYGRLAIQIRKKSSNPSHKVDLGQFALDDSFNEAMGHFRTAGIGNVVQLVKREIIQECTPILNYVNDIPRLYRRTNKEKPSKASVYIDNCFTQLLQFKSLIGLDANYSNLNDEWIVQVITDLAIYYKNATLEVLTSVQKTEDSLKKLKKAKQNSQQFPNSNYSTMSDDDKIRLQIYFDVEEFGKQMKSQLGISTNLVKPYLDLSSMVSSLKILT